MTISIQKKGEDTVKNTCRYVPVTRREQGSVLKKVTNLEPSEVRARGKPKNKCCGPNKVIIWYSLQEMWEQVLKKDV